VSRFDVRLNDRAPLSIGDDMTKELSMNKIKGIIKLIEKGELSTWQIAKLKRVSERHVRRLYTRYKDTGKYPYPQSRGKKAEPISIEIQKQVIDTFNAVPIGAVKMEMYFRMNRMPHVPHNTIHKILLDNNLAKENPKKKRARKTRFFARRFSNHLWHTDYCKIGSKHYIAFIDDASRMILASGEFDNATAKNANSVLKKAIRKHGVPKQLLTDNGTHFLSLIRQGCPDPEHTVFQKTLDKHKIHHIKTRVHHPQTNGKMERWFGTIKRLLKHYGDLATAVYNYNYVIPHLSLTTCAGPRTPAQAYIDKGGIKK
jgi:putative transposase